MDRIFQMVMRLVLRRLVNRGMRAGLKGISGDQAAPVQIHQAQRSLKVARRIGRL
ncbi:hypothetical protein [uncultured Roseobacter sp.]|uniref:hypothetical protein n=1 Tax=uncultured Roseobacter sp. TaxID=114847 RepID=UPI0026243493|nr:hypothetical protein [uncultured Roseobacter sp.]